MKLSHSLLALSLVSVLAISCKKKDNQDAAPASTTTTATTSAASSEYFIKYDVADTTYHFKSASPFSSYGTESATCRIGYPDDFYTGIDISIESPYGINLKYSDIKAMEGKYIPLKCTDSVYSSGIFASIETATPGTFYSYQVDYATQKGRFFIEKVTPIAMARGSSNKRCEVKGTFSCNVWPNSPDTVEFSNGSFLILLALWPED